MSASPISYPLVNGARHSFVSIELKLMGVIFQGFTSINYTRTRSRTMVYGNSPDPWRHIYSQECSPFAQFGTLIYWQITVCIPCPTLNPADKKPPATLQT